jgi:glucosamine 6-phosphate synthetase-like amidotransferase/phosphosugar isomerase protein
MDEVEVGYDEIPSDVRHKHPYHMYDEIKAQPGVVGRSLSLAEQHARDARKAIAAARRVYLTGCGTSFNAAAVGAWFFRSLSRGGIDARAAGALDVALYEMALGTEDVVVAVTHSGETTMTLRALERARDAGARTVAVTGFPDRLTSAAVDHVIPTGFPEERSWAHTASYTGALTTLAAMANDCAHPDERLDLSPLPEVTGEALGLEEMAHRVAGSTLAVERFREPSRIVLVGGGPNAVTAQEGVLKLLETSYVKAEAFELEYMLHGPLAAVTSESLLVVLAPSGASTLRAADLVRAARQLDVLPVVLAGSDTADDYLDAHRLILPDVPEILSPIPYVVPLQFFAYFLAFGKGLNPDLIHRDDERHRAARSEYV